MTTPSQVPARFPSGVSTDYPWGPLANYGLPNPAFYQVAFTDFMSNASDLFASGIGTGTGNAVTFPGTVDGGAWLLTTSTSGAGTSGVVGSYNEFFLPPLTYAGGNTLTGNRFPSKKVFYATRINVTTVATTAIWAGFVPATFTGAAAPTDGVVINITNATTGNLIAYSGSTVQWTVPIPLGAFTTYYANTTWVDLAIYIDRLTNVYAFIGYPLFGWLPASAWPSSTQPGPLGAVAAYQVGVSGAWTPTTAGLTPGLVATGTIQTAYVDFLFGAKER